MTRGSAPASTRRPARFRSPLSIAVVAVLVSAFAVSWIVVRHDSGPRVLFSTPITWHTKIVATTFWVGENFDPKAADGSQVYSTYDSSWAAHYGGCDGVSSSGHCQTEKRVPPDYFPDHMTPRQNPFYLDLPFDDINDATAFRERCAVVPWANQAGFAGHCADPNFSYMKNHWVAIEGPNGRRCYGQIEDAGPGQYHDVSYVFGAGDRRPKNARYGGAGMDVSPALNGCLGMKYLNGDTDRLSWRFTDARQVPPGPWTKIVTTLGLVNN